MSDPSAGGIEALPLPVARRLHQVCKDFEAAWQAATAGSEPRLEDYLADTPEPGRSALLRELLPLEAHYRRRAGQTPRPEDYQGRFPSLDSAWLASAVAEETADERLTTGGQERPPGPAPDVGTLLSGYELLEVLGKGGMGVVYRAWQRDADRIVALKLIRADRLEDMPLEQRRQWLERFRTEAQAAARLEHDHVVTVYQVGEIAGQPFYSMRYVEGRSLADVLAEGPLPGRKAAAYLEAVARAVQHAHEQGILHRDLKPRNILVDGADRPFVADFGLAKYVEGAEGLTQTGGCLGTPSYMAPEQAQDAAHVTAASDVYSLGATLYDLVTGRPPFQAATVAETLHQVLHQEPVPPRQLNPAIDRDLETITLKCLHKEPGRRYSSAAALAEDLRRYLNGEPIHARPVSRMERAWRWCRRKPASAAAVGLTLLTLVTAIVVPIVFALSIDAERKNTAEEARQKGDALEEARQREDARKRQFAELLFEQAHAACMQEGPARGVVWLAHNLREVSKLDVPDVAQSIRLHLAGWSRELRPLRVVLPHQGNRPPVVLSPDGRVIATASEKDRAQLWEVATGKPVGPPLQHDKVVAVAFSPDGQTVATAGLDKLIQLWDAKTGKPLGSLREGGYVDTMAFSPDSQTLVTASGYGKAQLWDVKTGKFICPPLKHGGVAIEVVAFSPDGRTVLTGSDGGTAQLWDAKTGKPIGPPLAHQLLPQVTSWGPGTPGEIPSTAVWHAAFSSDGKFALTGSRQGEVRRWDVKTGKLLGPATGPPTEYGAKIRPLAFSPGGQTVLTGETNASTAQLWDVKTGKALAPPLQHPPSPEGGFEPNDVGIWTVAFAPDGRNVITGSHDRTARVWAMTRGMPQVGPPLHHQGPVFLGEFTPDGQTIVTGSRQDSEQSKEFSVRLWQAATGKHLAPEGPRREPRPLLSYDPDGKTVRTTSGAVLPVKGRIMALAVSPDGQSLLTRSDDRTDHTAQLWDVKTGKALGSHLQHHNQVQTAAFSPDSRTVLTGSEDKTTRLWDVKMGTQIGPSWQNTYPVRSDRFSPGGQIVEITSETTYTTASKTRVLTSQTRLWEIKSGKQLGLLLLPNELWAISPDDQAILRGQEGTVRLLDVKTGEPLGPPLVHQRRVTQMVFSPDGKTVATRSDDGTIRLWEPRSGKPLGLPLQHQGRAGYVDFSPEGQVFLSSNVRMNRLWETRTGKPIGLPFEGSALGQDADGRAMSLVLWPAPFQADPERIVLWTQVLTGMEVEQAAVRVLDPSTWAERRRRLDELGGPLLP